MFRQAKRKVGVYKLRERGERVRERERHAGVPRVANAALARQLFGNETTGISHALHVRFR